MLGLGGSASNSSSVEHLYSLLLDGTGDFVTTDFVPNKNVGTFSFWFNIDTLKDYNTLFENAVDANDWECWVEGDGDIFFRTDAGDVVLTKSSAISTSTWYHVGITYTQSGGGVLYINGAAVHTDGNVAGSRPTPEEMTIGGGALNTDFHGNIDEFAVWNVALDADAIAAVYNSGKPFELTNNRGSYDNASNLQGYWRLNNDAIDYSSNANNGTLAGNATFSASTPDD